MSVDRLRSRLHAAAKSLEDVAVAVNQHRAASSLPPACLDAYDDYGNLAADRIVAEAAMALA